MAFKFVGIKSINRRGTEHVYDISNYDQRCKKIGGNFVANGIVVHNCIPDYVERRDDPDEKWRNIYHPAVTKILESTFSVLTYQEQLTSIWQLIGGFTGPEAQDGRKAVAKKQRDRLEPIRKKWMIGATPVIGEEQAKILDNLFISFARYCFNYSHAVSYCLVAFKCLWLKSYFPFEWWSSVMSYCNPKKMTRYMNVARSDGVRFAPVDVNKLTMNFLAIPENTRTRHTDPVDGYIVPGLVCIKGVGKKVASEFDTDIKVQSVDEFVEKHGKNKTLLERLIKLGAFTKLPGHANIKAVWQYYFCKYCSGKGVAQAKEELRYKIKMQNGWTDAKIREERVLKVDEYRRLYPKRKKIPKKIAEWSPVATISLPSVVEVTGDDDFNLAEILKFEETYLGYFLHSPVDLFETKGDRSISDAKTYGEVEAVIIEVFLSQTKTGAAMCKLSITDGLRSATLMLWSDNLDIMDMSVVKVGAGFRARVNWDKKRKNFTLQRGCSMVMLRKKR